MSRIAVLLGTAAAAVVFVLALVFVGRPVPSCLALTPCQSLPDWLASLSPLERFEVEHRDLLIWLDLAGALIVGLAVAGILTLAARRRRGARRAA